MCPMGWRDSIKNPRAVGLGWWKTGMTAPRVTSGDNPMYCSLSGESLIWPYIWARPGTDSISHTTSYRKISHSHENTGSLSRDFPIVWNLAGVYAAQLPRHLPNFKAIRPFKIQCRGFQTSRDLTILRLMGHWNAALCVICVICTLSDSRYCKRWWDFPG